MSNLRTQIIKLAQQKPELRPHLVPLLRKAAVKTWDSGFSDTAVAGDRRYQYVPFHKLTPVVQNQARGQYPHKNVGAAYDFLDEHYFYPVKQDGSLARAQRNLAIPLAKIKNRQYMDGLGYTLNPGWEGRVASDDRWERSIAASCMPRQAGCEKLPEGGMRDNCEKKVEEGKGKTAGYSFAEDTAWFAFIGNKTPFNVDVIEKITYTPLKFRDDDGQMQEDLGMRVSQSISYSPSLTRGQEMAGAVREIVFAVKYPRGSLRQVQAALMAIGKALKFQVEYLPSPRKAQTRQKSR